MYQRSLQRRKLSRCLAFLQTVLRWSWGLAIEIYVLTKKSWIDPHARPFRRTVCEEVVTSSSLAATCPVGISRRCSLKHMIPLELRVDPHSNAFWYIRSGLRASLIASASTIKLLRQTAPTRMYAGVKVGAHGPPRPGTYLCTLFICFQYYTFFFLNLRTIRN